MGFSILPELVDSFKVGFLILSSIIYLQPSNFADQAPKMGRLKVHIKKFREGMSLNVWVDLATMKEEKE